MSFLNREFSSKLVSILGLKARGFRIKIYSLAVSLSCSFPSVQLEQPTQEHAEPQSLLLAKHSQYNFKHLDLLQLQGFMTLLMLGN